MTAELTRDLDEAGVVRLAGLLALKLRRGDVVTLAGEVGAGKTTLARALISALTGDSATEVPSPTFSLVASACMSTRMWSASPARRSTSSAACAFSMSPAKRSVR